MDWKEKLSKEWNKKNDTKSKSMEDVKNPPDISTRNRVRKNSKDKIKRAPNIGTEKNRKAQSLAFRKAMEKVKDIKKFGISSEMSLTEKEAAVEKYIAEIRTEKKRTDYDPNAYIEELKRFAKMDAQEQLNSEYETVFPRYASEEELKGRVDSLHYRLDGDWNEGYAYDLYSYRSTPKSGRFETIHSEMGALVYRLKYQEDPTAVGEIIYLLKAMVTKPHFFDNVDLVVPIPPSNLNRPQQPVDLIATEFGKRFGIDICLDAMVQSAGSQEKKEITNYDDRKTMLKKSMKMAKLHNLSNKNILLIDDVYESGSTLEIATELLKSSAGVKDVYVFSMTKKR